nr:WGR domain-containing protein [Bradyrhizobium elkanii]
MAPRIADHPFQHRRIDARLQYAAVDAVSTQPTLFREMSLIRHWGWIGTNGKTMVQTFDGSAGAIDAFGRLDSTNRRRGYAAVDEKRHSLEIFRGFRLCL